MSSAYILLVSKLSRHLVGIISCEAKHVGTKLLVYINLIMKDETAKLSPTKVKTTGMIMKVPFLQSYLAH